MIIETPIPGRMHRGKVRDTYDLGGWPTADGGH